MREWKYTSILSKWSKLSALGHSHFTPRGKSSLAPTEEKAVSDVDPAWTPCRIGRLFLPTGNWTTIPWLSGPSTNLFTDQTILAPPKLKNFDYYSCNSPTLNFMKILYKSILYKSIFYTRLQTGFRFLTSQVLILSLALCFQTQWRILFMVLNAK